MKDFFDCYQILTTRNLNDETLYDAIKATFDNRKLERNLDLQLFTPKFVADEPRLVRWNAFLKKIQLKEKLEFSDVMALITTRLKPMYDAYWREF